MINFLEIKDYRDFLKNYYERRKEKMPLYSYRMMGAKLGLDASYLYRIIQKKHHLPTHTIALAKEMLDLSDKAAEYFDILVACSKTNNPEIKFSLIEKAINLRNIEKKELTDSELLFLSNWKIPAIRALLDVTKGQSNPHEIAKKIKPAITEAEAQEALDCLIKLGFISKNSSGNMKLNDPHLTVSVKASEKIKAVRGFQKQVLELAENALDNCPINERDISTLTIAVDLECFEDIRDMLQEFRRLIQKRVDETKSPDRVMHLSMAFYPITQTEEYK